MDQDGASHLGELEESFMQGVDGTRETDRDINSAFLATKPPTLNILPPMRFHQTPRENTQIARSTSDSGSSQNSISQIESESPASRKAFSEMYAEHKKQQQEIMMTTGASRTTTTTTRSLQLSSQEKRKMTGSTAARDGKTLDAKTIRRLAQNREAARKSRLRKKAYVQQLETCRIRLQQMEQDLQRARSQGFFVGVAGTTNGATSSAAAMFDTEYGRWLDDNCRHRSELRGALQGHLPDGNLSHIVDRCITHLDDLFRLKAIVVNSDVFHLLNGTWKTPAERCFLWMGGFRPSELISILIPQLDLLSEQQFVGMCGLQHSSQQAEEALSQGFEQLHQALAKTVAEGSISDSIEGGNYVMGHMALALRKLANLEGFVIQADNLRQQTLHQLRQILTVRQAARCFLAIGEYHTRLRALSSLWASRPPESLMAHDSVVPTASDIQAVHQPLQNHFPGY